MPQYNEQKIHLTRADIPDKDKGTFIILKKNADCLSLSEQDFSKIHPYCLDISVVIAENLPINLQKACTSEQIVYIPTPSLSYFSDSFFDYWTNKLETEDKTIHYSYRLRHTDGTVTYEEEDVLLSDKILVAKSQKMFRTDILNRKKRTRSRIDEPLWKSENRIPLADIMECLDMSSKGVETIFGKPIDTIKLRGRQVKTYNYKEVLQKLENCLHIAPISKQSEFVKEELGKIGHYDNEGKYHLERMPILYQSREMLRQLGFLLSKNSSKIAEEIFSIARNGQYIFEFKELNSRGVRYSKSTIQALNRNLDVRAKRDKNNKGYNIPNPKTCFFDY